MFDWLKKSRKKKRTSTDDAADLIKGVAEKVTVAKVTEPLSKTEKQIANEKGEPYVAVLSMDVDPNNLHQGAFELDWNEIFVARLIKAGYMMKPTDSDGEIVDRWFQNVCRHVVMETWEQEQAIKNSGMYVQKRDLGDGRSEIG
jgi:meiotically up-regulated gene 157 (Mug157) protein